MITELFNHEWENILLALYLVFLVYIVFVFTWMKRMKYKNKIKRSFKLITKGVEDDTINNKDDILLIYKSVMSYYTLADFLDEYIIYLRNNKDEKENADVKIDVDLFNKIRKFIKSIVDEERQEKPFEGVDSYEQRLLNIIDEAAQSGEKKSVYNNLKDLAVSIKNNQKRLKSANLINVCSIPATIISIIITLFIWWFGRTSISTKDLETIKQDNRAVFIEVIDSLQNRHIENDNQ